MRAAPDTEPGAGPRRLHLDRVVGVFRDPLRTLVLLGVVAGGFMVFAVPNFSGIDEGAHFYRSYQLSTGTLVPEKPAGSDFAGACVPASLVRDVRGHQQAYFDHQLEAAGLPPQRFRVVTRPCGEDADHRFVNFSTFGSPLPYLPQAAAISLARALGADADGMLHAGRLALLAVFLALVATATRRAPRGKWAFATVGLVPVALFQASASLSHDAITLGVSLVVVSSALRALDPPPGVTTGALVVEAFLLSIALAFCKPGYVVVAFAYLLPLVSRARRRREWPLALAPVVAGLVTLVWNLAVGGLWKSDAELFGVPVDPDRQRELLLTEPWHFAGAAITTVVDSAWQWIRTYTSVGLSVTDWPAGVGVAGSLVLLLVALQSFREPESRLRVASRLVVFGLLVLVVVIALGAQYVYWSAPGDDRVSGMQARFFLPGLVLLPLALGPVRARWADSREATVPLALLAVPVLALFCVTLTRVMR
jgi:hypothetical protein